MDQGLLRARSDSGGGGGPRGGPGGGPGGGHGGHGGGQSWARKEGDSDGGNEPWVRENFGEPSTWSEATPPGSAGATHLGPHIVSLIQILLLT